MALSDSNTNQQSKQTRLTPGLTYQRFAEDDPAPEEIDLEVIEGQIIVEGDVSYTLTEEDKAEIAAIVKEPLDEELTEMKEDLADKQPIMWVTEYGLDQTALLLSPIRRDSNIQ